MAHTLGSIVRDLMKAVEEAEAQQVSPENDPAVLVLAIFTAFHSHADTVVTSGLYTLLELCQQNHAQVPR